MTIEIVDFPMKNGGSFHRFLYVYQRLMPLKGSATPQFTAAPKLDCHRLQEVNGAIFSPRNHGISAWHCRAGDRSKNWSKRQPYFYQFAS